MTLLGDFILFGAPLIDRILIAALTGVMFVVVIATFEWSTFKMIGKIPLPDLLVVVAVTGITVWHDPAVAVFSGVVLSVLVFAWKSSKNLRRTIISDAETERVYRLEGLLYFASVQDFAAKFNPADIHPDWGKRKGLLVVLQKRGSLSFAMRCAVYDTKPYDREFLTAAAQDMGVEFRFLESRLDLETVALAEGVETVCIFVNDRADRPVLEKLKKLGIRHIALRCAGFNQVDLSAAKELGIQVTRVPSYSPHAVAEHTVALLQTLNRKIHRAYNRVREQNFSLNGLVGFDLYGKTVGIVGTGKIGRITAQIFRGFGCEVLVYDVYQSEAWAQENGIAYTSLNDLLERSDVISLHLPLFPGTFHLIDETALARMKKGVFLINTSRGKLIETKALIENLKTGRLGGVALDVYEVEEGIFFEDHSGAILQDDDLSRLLTFPNVLITSHQAFLTKEALGEIARVTVENIRSIGEGCLPIEGTQL